MDIAVVGSNMVDLISYIDRMPTEGETVEAPDFRLGCGGKGANQAVAASRLGSDVLMVTRVGNDMFADNTIRNLEDNGIDTTYVMRTEATSGVAPIFVDPQSRNSIIIVKGANAKLCADDIAAARQAIAGCKLIITQLEIPLETVYTTVDLAGELGIPVLLNPAPADPRMSLDRVRGVEFIVPNESELSLISDARRHPCRHRQRRPRAAGCRHPPCHRHPGGQGGVVGQCRRATAHSCADRGSGGHHRCRGCLHRLLQSHVDHDR